MMNNENNLIDGKAIAETIKNELILDTERIFKGKNIVPKLSVVILGEDPASLFYVRMIERTCKKVGFQFEKHALALDTSEEDLLALIEKLNKDEKMHGIIVQTPLPPHVNQKNIQRALTPEKDVDCFNPVNMGNLALGVPVYLPCTPNAVYEILKRENIEVEGKYVTIVGRSSIVGKPLALILLLKQPNANATVTVCHSRTGNLADFTRKADIIVAAAGKAGIITGSMVEDNTVVIDVGTNEVEGKLFGDVNFEEVSKIASRITPVPGGVGPVTNMMLMKNTLQAAKNIAGNL